MNYREFWTSPWKWPTEKKGFVFLARAMKEAAVLRFGGEWTGNEPWTPVPDGSNILPEDQSRASLRQMQRAYKLAGIDVPATPPIDETLKKGGGIAKVLENSLPPQLPDLMWMKLRGEQMEEVIRQGEARQRFLVLCRETQRLLLDNHLKLYVRGLLGGEVEGPLDPMLWNTEKAFVRFAECQIDLANPYDQAWPDERVNIRRNNPRPRPQLRWMFVDEDSRDNWLAGLRKVHSPAADSTRIEEPGTVKLARRKGGARTPAQIAEENACRDWLIEIMKADPDKEGIDGQPAPLKDDLRTAAEKKWPGLPTRAFDRAYSNAVAAGSGRFKEWTNQYLVRKA